MKIGFAELIIVLIVALVIIGPEKLPYYAKKCGNALGTFRKATEEAASEFTKEAKEPFGSAEVPKVEQSNSPKPADEAQRQTNNIEH